jgi:ATP-dependent Zn protease
MVAEEIDLGESTTGPLADLTEATKLASMMVGALGMGGSLVSFATGVPGEDVIKRVLEDKPSRAATEQILDQAKADVAQLLHRHRGIHCALRDALLEREELVGEEILEVIRAAILRDRLAEIDLREPVIEPATQEEGPAPLAPQ